MPRAVWGLDIGFSSIKAVQMERMGSVAEVTSFDVIEIEPSDDDSTRPGRVQAALSELIGRHRLVGLRCNFRRIGVLAACRSEG